MYKPFKGNWGFGIEDENGVIPYDGVSFSSETKAQMIANAHNMGAKSYVDACVEVNPRLASAFEELRQVADYWLHDGRFLVANCLEHIEAVARLKAAVEKADELVKPVEGGR
jgi:hypothetical protein